MIEHKGVPEWMQADDNSFKGEQYMVRHDKKNEAMQSRAGACEVLLPGHSLTYYQWVYCRLGWYQVPAG